MSVIFKVIDEGDARRVDLDLGDGRVLTAVIPKSATVVEISGFIDHLVELAKRQEREKAPQ